MQFNLTGCSYHILHKYIALNIETNFKYNRFVGELKSHRRKFTYIYDMCWLLQKWNKQ